jgi:hypothetical protein
MEPATFLQRASAEGGLEVLALAQVQVLEPAVR